MIGIISHWDIDGIASAAMLATTLGVSKDNIRLSSTTKTHYYLKELKKARAKEIYIADLNPGPDIAELILKETTKKCQTRIHWIDHHLWDDDTLETLKLCSNIELILSPSAECTSKLIIQTVLRGYDIPSHLLDLMNLAEDDDTYSNKYELTPKWRIILRWGDWEIRYKTLESWIDGYIWPKWAQEFYEKAHREYRELMEKAIGTAEYSLFDEKRIIFLYPSEKIHPGDLQRFVEERSGSKADVYVFVYKKGISLRSKTVDVSLLAKAMGGGGHKYAAGVILREPLEDKESIKQRIVSIFKKIYQRK
ncbi:MAG: DHHA1 domain-containing protein [Fervidicoccaceae archaeon]